MPADRATTVDDYIAKLPEERRDTIATLREIIRKNLPKGYQEGIAFGIIGYSIPLSRLPNTYNGQPLMYAGLAVHKSYCSLYLMAAYAHPPALEHLQDGFRKAGKKLDMGKSCIRFKTLDDLPLDVIAESIASVPAENYIATYEASRALTKSGAKKTARNASKQAAKRGRKAE